MGDPGRHRDASTTRVIPPRREGRRVCAIAEKTQAGNGSPGFRRHLQQVWEGHLRATRVGVLAPSRIADLLNSHVGTSERSWKR